MLKIFKILNCDENQIWTEFYYLIEQNHIKQSLSQNKLSVVENLDEMVPDQLIQK